jgi:cysteinyl-tRNA synthetase
MACRLFLLGGHYRSQLGFSTAALDAAQATLRRLASRIEPLHPLPPAETLTAAVSHAGGDTAAARMVDQIDEAIASDLATPRILAVLQDALRDPALCLNGRRAVIAAADSLLGLGLAALRPRQVDSRPAASGLSPEELHVIERLIAERSQARNARDWARADEIRGELDRFSVIVTDTPNGSVWELR